MWIVVLTHGMWLEVVALPMDSEALLKSEQGIALLVAGDTLRLNRELARVEMEANLGSVSAFVEACRGADLILSGSRPTKRKSNEIDALRDSRAASTSVCHNCPGCSSEDKRAEAPRRACPA
jgi:hypothetical protein